MSTADEDFSTPAASEAGGSTTSAGRAASFDPLGMVRHMKRKRKGKYEGKGIKQPCART